MPAQPVSAKPFVAHSKTTKPRPTPTARAKKGKTAAECERIGNESTLPNADLYPYLRSIGCGALLDSGIQAAEQKYGPGAHSGGSSPTSLCTSANDPPAKCPKGYASNVGDRGADPSSLTY
jgi:hypothetical protein